MDETKKIIEDNLCDFESLIENKISELREEKREGIDDIVRLGQITILQEMLLENYRGFYENCKN